MREEETARNGTPYYREGRGETGRWRGRGHERLEDRGPTGGTGRAIRGREGTRWAVEEAGPREIGERRRRGTGRAIRGKEGARRAVGG